MQRGKRKARLGIDLFAWIFLEFLLLHLVLLFALMLDLGNLAVDFPALVLEDGQLDHDAAAAYHKHDQHANDCSASCETDLHRKQVRAGLKNERGGEMSQNANNDGTESVRNQQN